MGAAPLPRPQHQLVSCFDRRRAIGMPEVGEDAHNQRADAENQDVRSLGNDSFFEGTPTRIHHPGVDGIAKPPHAFVEYDSKENSWDPPTKIEGAQPIVDADKHEENRGNDPYRHCCNKSSLDNKALSRGGIRELIT